MNLAFSEIGQIFRDVERLISQPDIDQRIIPWCTATALADRRGIMRFGEDGFLLGKETNARIKKDIALRAEGIGPKEACEQVGLSKSNSSRLD